MMRFEYKVVPAPSRGQKAKGVKTPESRFAHALEQVMNDMAAEGWEYLRAETLPSEERSGLTSTTTTYRHVLVFRRPRPSDPAPFQPELLEAGAPKAILVPPAAPSTDLSAPDTPANDAGAAAEPETPKVPEQAGVDRPEIEAEDPDETGDDTPPAPGGSGRLGPATGAGGPSPALGGASRGGPAANAQASHQGGAKESAQDIEKDNGVEDTQTLDTGFSEMLRRRAAQVMGRTDTPKPVEE
ncbi:DUF4177 domain-containing protein [Pseudooceanicola nanhaiensis]|uniref:DUF4177 domain-containing protein n=1 Tax=Pseudooceanicola nanhaiensis TaxID=375761 RepID=UPI00398FAC08